MLVLLLPTGLSQTNGETATCTSHQNKSIKTDQDAVERTEVFGATPSLTRVWTLGRLEAGCFYFHVQHNMVYKMELIWSEDNMGETALHGNNSTSISPPAEATAPVCPVRTDGPAGPSVLWKPLNAPGHLCAVGSERDQDVPQYYDAGQATVHKQIPEFLTEEMNRLRNMAAHILFVDSP